MRIWMSAWPTARSESTCSCGVSEFHTDASVDASTSAMMAAALISASRWAISRLVAPRAIHAASRPETIMAIAMTAAAKTTGCALEEKNQSEKSFNHCMRRTLPAEHGVAAA